MHQSPTTNHNNNSNSSSNSNNNNLISKVPVCRGTSATLTIIGMQNWKCIRKPLSRYLSTTSCIYYNTSDTVLLPTETGCANITLKQFYKFTLAPTHGARTLLPREKNLHNTRFSCTLNMRNYRER